MKNPKQKVIRPFFRVNHFFLFIFLLVVSADASAQTWHKRQMRAVWLATVENIDFPSTPALTTAQQKQELINLLDNFKACNINTVIFQVRPTADALYLSNVESWSKFLTGTAGKSPIPYYDPLQFLIQEAQKRCMEVHAWINPYRVLNGNDTTEIDPDHLFFKNRRLFVKYGEKYYFNPAYKETREYLVHVVEDLVKRYDIQAVHFDDYFYPYRVTGEEFPDEEAFLLHSRGLKDKDEWRRDNVNLIIKQLSQTIKAAKPWVEFGISPFGVWRNKSKDRRGSISQTAQTNYDDLYADVLKWLEDEDIDYVMPQLYWHIGRKDADYALLAEWWSKHCENANLYIGLYASGLGTGKESSPWRTDNELARQLRFNEQFQEIKGVAFYSGRPFAQNPQGIRDSLARNYFKYPALVPLSQSSKGQETKQPQNLRIVGDNNRLELRWDEVREREGRKVQYYVVYCFRGKEVGDLDDPAHILTLTPNLSADLKALTAGLQGEYTLTVTSVNRYKRESKAKNYLTIKINS